MYTDERPRRGGLLKEFIMKLILIIIFVLLLIWLVPWPNMDGLNPLKDQIFNANLQTMKEAGITYFTTERLPQNVGDKTTLTLQKMLDMKLLIPFTDKNGNSCDVKKSFVSLEKQETEYLMKVNLKCGEEEDYILVHLGCYSYCTSAICEAKPGNTEKPTTTPKKVVKDNITPTPTTPGPVPTYVTTYTCRVVNGSYWGKYGRRVDQNTYKEQCETPVVTPTPTATPTPTTQTEKEYQYVKRTVINKKAQYTDWTAWKEYVYKESDNIKFVKTDTKEVEDLGTRYVKIGTQAAVYDKVTVTKKVLVQSSTVKYAVCKNYQYYADANKIVKIDSDWAYIDNWYQGFNPPADTQTSRWIFQGIDYAKCGNDCANHPYVIYREQKRNVTTYTEYSNVTANCTDIVEKDVPIYAEKTVTETKTVKLQDAKDIYGNVRYYRVRTRILLEAAKEIINYDYKWSFNNDTTLLNSGYSYTGKTRDKVK